MSRVWRRRLGGRRLAHLYIDGRALCPWGGREGSPLVVETKLSTSGMPFGNVCAHCRHIALDRLAAGVA